MRRGKQFSRRKAPASEPAPRHGRLSRDELERRRVVTDLRRNWVAAQIKSDFMYRTLDDINRGQPTLYGPYNVEAPRPKTPPKRSYAVFSQSGFLTIEHPNYTEVVSKDTGEITRIEKDCKPSKDDRRHAIIAGGYGGVNGVTKYKPHSEC